VAQLFDVRAVFALCAVLTGLLVVPFVRSVTPAAIALVERRAPITA